jgi:dienelactone hydrolase
MKIMLPLALMLTVAVPAAAALRGGTVEYRHGDVLLEGYLAWDDSLPGTRPGVVVFHDWMGVSGTTREVVDRLAVLGYLALAADVYGKGIRPGNASEAATQAALWRKDRPALRARARAGLDFLLANPLVDPARVAATGYCFGGGTALELARSGAPLAGVVSFHGNLDTPLPAPAGSVKAKVLVQHGADDSSVPMAQVMAFVEELRAAGADWYLTMYGNAVHSFTNKGAGNDNATGNAYNEKADLRSWQAMRDFLGEVFR